MIRTTWRRVKKGLKIFDGHITMFFFSSSIKFFFAHSYFIFFNHTVFVLISSKITMEVWNDGEIIH